LFQPSGIDKLGSYLLPGAIDALAIRVVILSAADVAIGPDVMGKAILSKILSKSEAQTVSGAKLAELLACLH